MTGQGQRIGYDYTKRQQQRKVAKERHWLAQIRTAVRDAIAGLTCYQRDDEIGGESVQYIDLDRCGVEAIFDEFEIWTFFGLVRQVLIEELHDDADIGWCWHPVGGFSVSMDTVEEPDEWNGAPANHPRDVRIDTGAGWK